MRRLLQANAFVFVVIGSMACIGKVKNAVKWLRKLTAYSKMDKLQVEYFDTERAEMKSTEMYIEGFKAKLEKDTSYKGLWTVSFVLKEF